MNPDTYQSTQDKSVSQTDTDPFLLGLIFLAEEVDNPLSINMINLYLYTIAE